MFLVLLRFCNSSWYWSCVSSPFSNLIFKSCSTALKNPLTFLSILPFKSNLVATSLAEFLSSRVVWFIVAPPTRNTPPTHPPDSAASSISSPFKNFVYPKFKSVSNSSWDPTDNCDKPVWPPSVKYSPAGDLTKLGIFFTDFLAKSSIPSLYIDEDIFLIFWKPMFLAKSFITPLAPTLSKAVPKAAKAAASALLAYLPSLIALAIFSSVGFTPSAKRPSVIAS